MSEMLGYEGNHPDGVRAVCKQCERIVLKETEYEAQQVVDSHNEQQHGGEDVAGICAWDIDPLIHDGQDAEQKLNVMMALQDTINDDDLSNEEKRKVLGMAGEDL